METRDCLKSRRSIRRFTDQTVTDEMLLELLEAVRWAPSWANTQCWELIIVREPASKQKLADLLEENNPAFKGVLEAPVVFVICARRGLAGFKKGETTTNKGDWFMFDTGIAAQNLCLTAWDMGLGTVHVGNYDHARVDEFLGLPAGVESVEIIPAGFPAKEGKAPPRKLLDEFVFNERYGQKLNGLNS